jgi:galactose-6-phosphate isomerase
MPPQLDVTDVLDDPDFNDFFSVRRPALVATSGGTATETDQTFTQCVGVVTPASPADVQLLPEGSFQQGVISIITKFRLQSGKGVDFAPDIVYWHGTAYTVMSISDWSGFGVGFIQAVARLRELNPPSAP